MRFSMKLFAVILCVLVPGAVCAGVESYTGTMRIVTVSGKGCEGLPATLPVSLFLLRNSDDSSISGFFDGASITAGKFSGSDLSRLEVRYPYHDSLKAGGHTLSITPGVGGLTAELRDRHLESSDEDCNFDQAHLDLKRADDDSAAESQVRRIATLFEAQLLRSQAMDLAGQGHYDSALPLYEKAFDLARPEAGASADVIAPYIVGLASVYVKLDRTAEFNKLYDEHFARVKDEKIKGIFSSVRIAGMFQEGKKAFVKEDYAAALTIFRQAYGLQPHNQEIISGIVMAHLRLGEYDSAIAFLEEALQKGTAARERLELRKSLALVYSMRAKKYDREGTYGQAEADLEKADNLDPFSTQYLIARARLRHKNGSYAEGESILEQGLKRFQQEHARQEIGAAHEKMRTVEAILEKLRKAGG